MEWSLGSWLPSHNISFKSVHNCLSNPANRQTDKHTDKHTDKQGWIHNIRPTTLANVMNVAIMLWCFLTTFCGNVVATFFRLSWNMLQQLNVPTFSQLPPNAVETTFLTTWRTCYTSWRHELPFDVMVYFSYFLTSWRTLYVMTYLPYIWTPWRTYLRHDVLFK